MKKINKMVSGMISKNKIQNVIDLLNGKDADVPSHDLPHIENATENPVVKVTINAT